MFEFSWKSDSFEIRSIQTNDKPYIELVKWCTSENKRSHCFVLASYHWDDEGGELHFIGNRPFEEIADINIQPIWKQLWLACAMLKDWYSKHRN